MIWIHKQLRANITNPGIFVFIRKGKSSISYTEYLWCTCKHTHGCRKMRKITVYNLQTLTGINICTDLYRSMTGLATSLYCLSLAIRASGLSSSCWISGSPVTSSFPWGSQHSLTSTKAKSIRNTGMKQLKNNVGKNKPWHWPSYRLKGGT